MLLHETEPELGTADRTRLSEGPHEDIQCFHSFFPPFEGVNDVIAHYVCFFHYDIEPARDRRRVQGEVAPHRIRHEPAAQRSKPHTQTHSRRREINTQILLHLDNVVHNQAVCDQGIKARILNTLQRVLVSSFMWLTFWQRPRPQAGGWCPETSGSNCGSDLLL